MACSGRCPESGVWQSSLVPDMPLAGYVTLGKCLHHSESEEMIAEVSFSRGFDSFNRLCYPF